MEVGRREVVEPIWSQEYIIVREVRIDDGVLEILGSSAMRRRRDRQLDSGGNKAQK